MKNDSMFKSEQAKQTITEWVGEFEDHLREKLHAQSIPLERSSVDTDYGKSSVLVAGSAQNPPLILLHGAMASAAHVLGEVWPLAAQFQIFAIDIVGQSVMSQERRISVKNNDYGVWLSQVMDGLGLNRVHVIGVSWGGFVAIRLAAVEPERIERMALVVPAGLVNGDLWPSLRKMALPMIRYSLSPSRQNIEKLLENIFTTRDDRWYGYMVDAFSLYNRNIDVPRLAGAKELEDFRAPVMVVGAENDYSFPGKSVLKRARRLFPGYQIGELLKNTLHSPPTTDEFRIWFSQRLLEFFNAPEAV